MQAFFPEQLGGVSVEQFYRAVNKVEPSLIRTESDELTYCLHIMVRYEIEKQLIGGTLRAEEVPAEWARLYREYLGVEVLSGVTGWLREHVHQYGQLLEPADVVRNACGTLDPQVYLDYLTRKYTELYAL